MGCNQIHEKIRESNKNKKVQRFFLQGSCWRPFYGWLWKKRRRNLWWLFWRRRAFWWRRLFRKMVKNKNSSLFTKKMNQLRKMNCPRCSTLLLKKTMRKIKHESGAVLDVCDNCGGMWLDENEVKLLYNFSKTKKVK